jgi:hypothetical protein
MARTKLIAQAERRIKNARAQRRTRTPQPQEAATKKGHRKQIKQSPPSNKNKPVWKKNYRTPKEEAKLPN